MIWWVNQRTKSAQPLQGRRVNSSPGNTSFYTKSNTTKNISSCHPSSWHYIQLGPEKYNKIPHHDIFSKNHLQEKWEVSCSFFPNKSIFGEKRLQKFTSTRGKETSKQERKTCSLESTCTGPIFTDTYLPLADNFCFTRPCNRQVNVLKIWTSATK